MDYGKTVTVTATQIIMAHGVRIIDHPVHETVVMEPVIKEQLVMAITVYAIQDGLVNFVRIKLQLLLAKIASIMAATFTMVTVSVTQIIKGHGVIGNALKVSPVQTAILLYAPIDVRVNRVG